MRFTVLPFESAAMIYVCTTLSRLVIMLKNTLEVLAVQHNKNDKYTGCTVAAGS